MKKYFILGAVALLIGTSYAAVEDTSIIDELNKDKTVLNAQFKLQTFETCTDMSTVMQEYIKLYWENSNRGGYYYPMLNGGIMVEEAVDDMMEMDTSASTSSMNQSKNNDAALPSTGGEGGGDYSETNVQVVGVDESDIIKTDGQYVYYFNDKDYYVYIVSISNRNVVKKIKIPDTFYSPILYLANGKLTILSSGYTDYDYSAKSYWIDRGQKTYVIVYDVTNVNSPILNKLYIVDGYMQESRRIGDNIYVISNTSFSLPYRYYSSVTKFEDFDYSVDKIMPQKIEVSLTDTKYSITSGNAADCDKISYVLPDAETIKQFGLSPSYNIVSVIDTSNPSAKIDTNVIAGSNNEIYMSKNNLYMTSYMYQNKSFACPINARCAVRNFDAGSVTLIHKLNINGKTLKYQDSAIIPGTPLTQYSMDEYNDNFRILTQTNNWTRSTNESYVDLYILDKNLNLLGSLEKLGEGEQFKSSRYIGEKLFLVTFEQVDPLFVIDVANPASPKVLGELKIPGYSTYLHPYDENHLIGLGYDTTENEWGGINNTGVKVDLYQINYNKKCGDAGLTADEQAKCDSGDYKGIIVKQLYTKTLGGYGSSSEAQYNPRMFMWHPTEKMLFLPVTMYTSAENDLYLRKDFFQGLVTLTIDKDTGITEDYRITHIDYSTLEQERLEACSKYTTESTTPKCVKLINGEEYCHDATYSYVPSYCYADAGIGEYLASRSWNYQNQYIKRALWVGNQTLAVSNDTLSVHVMKGGTELYRVKFQ